MAGAEPVVMLVDDEPRILSSLTRMLRREGLSLVSARNAKEALDVLRDRAVDLVVSDHKMPGGTGVDLLTQVASEWPETSRILLSGWVNEIDPERLEAARVEAVLPKPWDEVELKAAIHAALRKACREN